MYLQSLYVCKYCSPHVVCHVLCTPLDDRIQKRSAGLIPRCERRSHLVATYYEAAARIQQGMIKLVNDILLGLSKQNNILLY